MRQAICLLGVIVLLVFPAASAQAELMAPVYPGAVPAGEELEENERYFEEAFYVRAPIEKIVAFYEENYGPMEEVRAGEKYRSVRRQSPRFKASFEPEQIGVRVYANPGERPFLDQPAGLSPDQAAKMQATIQDRCGSEHFARLRLMAHQLDKYDWKDFKEVCDRFDHIDRAYFRLTGQWNAKGEVLRRDQVMLKEQQDKMGLAEPEQMDAEQLAQRMEELQQQGRFQEMAELARKFQDKSMRGAGMAPAGKVHDNWHEWISYLEKLDNHAFQTFIRINKDPSAWPDRAIR